MIISKMFTVSRFNKFVFGKSNLYFQNNNFKVLTNTKKNNVSHQDFLINYYQDLVPVNIKYLDTIKSFREYNNTRINKNKDKNIEKKKEK